MLNLKGNIGITVVGTIVFAASQWAIVSILAKMSGPTQVGIYALAMSITGPIFALANMNLRAVQSTDVYEQFSTSDYTTFRTLTSISALSIIIVIALLFNKAIEVAGFILVYGIAKFFESFSELRYGQFQKAERMDLVSKSTMLRGLSSLCIFSITFHLTNNLIASGLSIACCWGLIAFQFDKWQAKEIGYSTLTNTLNFNISNIKSLALKAAPLGFTVFTNTLNVNIPRYFLVEQMGAYQLGIYSALSYFIVAGATLINAMGQSATPRLAKLYATNLEGFMSLQIKLLSVALLVSIAALLVALLAGNQILVLFFTEAFITHDHLFPWVMAAGSCMHCSSMIGCGLTAMREFKVQAKLSVLVVLILFACCYPLIKLYGMVGAALAIMIAYIIKFIIACIIMKKSLSNRVFTDSRRPI